MYKSQKFFLHFLVLYDSMTFTPIQVYAHNMVERFYKPPQMVVYRLQSTGGFFYKGESV